MALGGVVVWGITSVATRVGPTVSGLLTPFPIATTILAAFTHRLDGSRAATQLLRSLLIGLFAFVAFLLVLGTTLRHWTLAAAFAAATVATLGVHALVWYWILKASPGAGAPMTERSRFDIPADVTYLNCANLGPRLHTVSQAGMDAIQAMASPWRIRPSDWFAGPDRLRILAADIMGADVDHVALVPATSYGIAIAAANVSVARGQTIIVLDGEFPSNVYAWRDLARQRGARLVTVERDDTRMWTESVLAAIDADTAVVALPNCHWTDGSLVDLEAVSARARAVGAALVIDASQSPGAYPLDIARIQPDVLVSVGYKWLLGPYGLGYLYVAPRYHAGIPLERVVAHTPRQ